MFPAAYRTIRFSANDGLALVGRHYRATGAGHRRPVLCLPGLTRNARDFHALALALISDPDSPRDVYALDFRGRGASAHDRDWRNYSLPVELADVQDFITITGLERPAIVGTSRGGLVTMLMGAMRPSVLGPVVLNDVGPVLEIKGLLRIMGYVGRMPLPASWDEAIAGLRRVHGSQFPDLSPAEWRAFAWQVYNAQSLDGRATSPSASDPIDRDPAALDPAGDPHPAMARTRPAPGYDPGLAEALAQMDLTKPPPALWGLFNTLRGLPVMLIRGALTDLLSAETVGTMRKVHPGLVVHEVPGQGHAPLLRDGGSQAAIAQFLRDSDGFGAMPVSGAAGHLVAAQ